MGRVGLGPNSDDVTNFTLFFLKASLREINKLLGAFMLSVVNILINVGILTLESLAIFPYLNHGGKCKNMLFFQFFIIMVFILNGF